MQLSLPLKLTKPKWQGGIFIYESSPCGNKLPNGTICASWMRTYYVSEEAGLLAVFMKVRPIPKKVCYNCGKEII